MRVGVCMVPRICSLLTPINFVTVLCNNTLWHVSTAELPELPVTPVLQTWYTVAACGATIGRILPVDIFAVPSQAMPNLPSHRSHAKSRHSEGVTG